MLPPVNARASVVILTHDRVDDLTQSLARITAITPRPPIVVVDNASRDGTLDVIARAFPDVLAIRAPGNLGAAGRNLGLRHAYTPYVALADDDTWWTADALGRAADLLDAHPRVAVVSGRVLVGAEERVDPICTAMATSPLPRDPSVAAPRLAGFLAGASMVRRAIVLSVGGFEPRLFLGSEETLLTADLAAAGWSTIYAHDVVVHHHPSQTRDAGGRRRLIVRNDLWFAWRRRALGVALTRTAALVGRSVRDPDARAGLVAAAGGLAWALRTRRPLPAPVEADYRVIDRWVRGLAGASTARARTRRHARHGLAWRAQRAASGSMRPPGA